MEGHVISTMPGVMLKSQINISRLQTMQVAHHLISEERLMNKKNKEKDTIMGTKQ